MGEEKELKKYMWPMVMSKGDHSTMFRHARLAVYVHLAIDALVIVIHLFISFVEFSPFNGYRLRVCYHKCSLLPQNLYLFDEYDFNVCSDMRGYKKKYKNAKCVLKNKGRNYSSNKNVCGSCFASVSTFERVCESRDAKPCPPIY